MNNHTLIQRKIKPKQCLRCGNVSTYFTEHYRLNESGDGYLKIRSEICKSKKCYFVFGEQIIK